MHTTPEAFQRIIDSLVAGILLVKPYLDDIINAGRARAVHGRSLHAVLEKIHEYWVHIDYARPIDVSYYLVIDLVIAEAYLKWIEIIRTRSITASSTI